MESGFVTRLIKQSVPDRVLELEKVTVWRGGHAGVSWALFDDRSGGECGRARWQWGRQEYLDCRGWRLWCVGAAAIAKFGEGEETSPTPTAFRPPAQGMFHGDGPMRMAPQRKDLRMNRFPNANGVSPSSPGLRAPRYPGIPFPHAS